jgi:hypothetical protein
MTQTRDWQEMRSMSVRLLKERTSENVDAWNRRVKGKCFKDEKSLRAWLTEQGVSGYAQSLLVMERFGYPDFLLASAEQPTARGMRIGHIVETFLQRRASERSASFVA